MPLEFVNETERMEASESTSRSRVSCKPVSFRRQIDLLENQGTLGDEVYTQKMLEKKRKHIEHVSHIVLLQTNFSSQLRKPLTPIESQCSKVGSKPFACKLSNLEETSYCFNKKKKREQTSRMWNPKRVIDSFRNKKEYGKLELEPRPNVTRGNKKKTAYRRQARLIFGKIH